MKIVIMGCGRVGAELAGTLHREGHEVIIMDNDPRAFRFLPDDFGGHRVVGSGIDIDVLERAGVRGADAFISATRGDNRNVMAAQLAKHMFGVRLVASRIFDPIREEMYRNLGLRTINPTKIQAGLLKEALLRPEPAEAATSDGRGEA